LPKIVTIGEKSTPLCVWINIGTLYCCVLYQPKHQRAYIRRYCKLDKNYNCLYSVRNPILQTMQSAAYRSD